MQIIDMKALCEYSKQFSGLDNEKIALLNHIYSDVSPRLSDVSDAFYAKLQSIPKTSTFLEGRIEGLKKTHTNWLHELFSSNFDEVYAQKMYNVGDVHVKVKLPVEFVTGAMTIIQMELLGVVNELYGDSPNLLFKIFGAINSATGFSQLIMQESYQSSSLAEELEKFLHITGMSRKLFDNLAKAYK